jgi:hypothetical protein
MVNFVWRERWLDCRCLRSPKKHLFAVWIIVVFLDSRHSLVSSGILSTQILLQSVCRQLPRFAHVTNRRIIPGRNHSMLCRMYNPFNVNLADGSLILNLILTDPLFYLSSLDWRLKKFGLLVFFGDSDEIIGLF